MTVPASCISGEGPSCVATSLDFPTEVSIRTYDFVAIVRRPAFAYTDVDGATLVKKYVQCLRSKLGDDPQAPQWIVNIYGVGYRFLGARDVALEEVSAN